MREPYFPSNQTFLTNKVYLSLSKEQFATDFLITEARKSKIQLKFSQIVKQLFLFQTNLELNIAIKKNS